MSATLEDLTRLTLDWSRLVPTGNSVKGCYAAPLGTCDGSISREHYMSENILEQFEKLSGKGIPWIPDGVDISPKSLATNCLCEKHNSFLSPLDEMAGKLFAHLVSFLVNDKRSIKVNGIMFELWLLKALLGLIATGKLEFKGRKFGLNDIPADWIRYLFYGTTLPDGYGMYVAYKPGDQIQTVKRFQMATLHIGEDIKGLQMELSGFRFILCLTSPTEGFKPEPVGQETIMRRLKKIRHGDYSKYFEFNWDLTR